jgi:hypothetical protein
MRIDGKPDGADFRVMSKGWGIMHRRGLPSLWRYDGIGWSFVVDLHDLDDLVKMLDHYRKIAPHNKEEQ